MRYFEREKESNLIGLDKREIGMYGPFFVVFESGGIDSDLKKFSVINLSCPWRGVMKFPEATVDAATKNALLYLYVGILP